MLSFVVWHHADPDWWSQTPAVKWRNLIEGIIDWNEVSLQGGGPQSAWLPEELFDVEDRQTGAATAVPCWEDHAEAHQAAGRVCVWVSLMWAEWHISQLTWEQIGIPWRVWMQTMGTMIDGRTVFIGTGSLNTEYCVLKPQLLVSPMTKMQKKLVKYKPTWSCKIKYDL